MRSIGGIREELAAWAVGFDASTLTIGQAQQVLEQAAAIERIAAAVKAEAATRVAEGDGWREDGHKSAAHALAQQTGTTIGAAREVLETGERLRELPDLAEAARAGVLSATQTAAVAAVGAVAPDLVGGFLDRARETTVGQLREECARAVASRHADPDAQRRRIREQRSLRTWTAHDGAGVLQLTDAPDVIAGVVANLGPMREGLFQQARDRGERVRPAALDADALLATVAAGAHGAVDPSTRTTDTPPHRCAPRSKVLVRVDFDALLRGRPIDGEVCEIAGYAPIAVSAVREMLATGDPFLAAIVSKGEQVLGVAHLGRKALAIQHTALEWTQPTCAVDGCTERRRLEIDHQHDWAIRRITLTDLLDRLCEHHHHLKTYEHWAFITTSNGKRHFAPPTHPANPHRGNRNRGDPTAA